MKKISTLIVSLLISVNSYALDVNSLERVMEEIIAQEGNNFGIIPAKLLLDNVKEKHHSQLIKLNEKTTIKNIASCLTYQVSIDECVEPNSTEIKYIRVDKMDKIFKAKWTKGNLSIVKPKTDSESIFIHKLNLLFSGKASDRLKELYLPGESETTVNLFSIPSMNEEFPSGHNGSNNWCGSEDGGDVPDFFPDSCQAHDLCYSSFNDKSLCDLTFYDHMYDEINYRYPGGAFLMLSIREGYFEAVVHLDAAFDQYCANKDSSVPTCNPDLNLNDQGEHNDDTTYSSGGGSTSESIHSFFLPGNGIGSQIYTYMCDVWEFPDGEGGVYEILRDCRRVR
jgi:hypothetical protein